MWTFLDARWRSPESEAWLRGGPVDVVRVTSRHFQTDSQDLRKGRLDARARNLGHLDIDGLVGIEQDPVNLVMHGPVPSPMR